MFIIKENDEMQIVRQMYGKWNSLFFVNPRLVDRLIDWFIHSWHGQIYSYFRYTLYAITKMMHGVAHFVSYMLNWPDTPLLLYNGMAEPRFQRVKRMSLARAQHLVYVLSNEDIPLKQVGLYSQRFLVFTQNILKKLTKTMFKKILCR